MRLLRRVALLSAALCVLLCCTSCKPSVPAEVQEVATEFLMARYGTKMDEALQLASGDARVALLSAAKLPEYTFHGASLERAESNRDKTRWSLLYTVTWELKEDGNTYYGEHEVLVELMKFDDGWKVYSFLWSPVPKI